MNMVAHPFQWRFVAALVLALLSGCAGSAPGPAGSAGSADGDGVGQDLLPGIPATRIDSAPEALTSTRTAVLAFSGEAVAGVAGFECSLGGQAFATCVSPAEYTDLADGEHRFSVRAVDAEGNVDPEPPVANWVVDASPPAGTLDAALAATRSTSLDLMLAATDAHPPIEFRLDGDIAGEGAWRALTASWTVTLLPGDGPKQVAARFRDRLGNTSNPQPLSVELDQTPPDLSVGGLPTAYSNADTVAIHFASSSSDLDHFRCRFNGDWLVPCESPFVRAGLEDGLQALAVVAVDLVGNAASTTTSWTVLTTPPTIRAINLVQGPFRSGRSPSASIRRIRWTASNAGSTMRPLRLVRRPGWLP